MNMNLIGAKVYYDGSHWIAIPHTERPPYKRKRRKRKTDKDETVKQFEKAFKTTPKDKKTKKKERLLKEFTPLFKGETEAAEFVEKQFERLNRNRIERYKAIETQSLSATMELFLYIYLFGRKTHRNYFQKKTYDLLIPFSEPKRLEIHRGLGARR